MALTRHATGHSAPRKTAETTTATITKKKPGSGRPKANTSKPRSTKPVADAKVKEGRVEKRGRPAKAKKVEVIGGEGTVKQKRKPTVKDKVEAVVDKVVGAVERKPGKKVRLVFLRFVVGFLAFCCCFTGLWDCVVAVFVRRPDPFCAIQGSVLTVGQAAGTKKIHLADGKGSRKA